MAASVLGIPIQPPFHALQEDSVRIGTGVVLMKDNAPTEDKWSTLRLKCLKFFKNKDGGLGTCHEFLVGELVNSETDEGENFWRMERWGNEKDAAQPRLNWDTILEYLGRYQSEQLNSWAGPVSQPHNLLPRANDGVAFASKLASSSSETRRYSHDALQTCTNLHRITHREGDNVGDEPEAEIYFSEHVNPLKLLVLASCIQTVAPDYSLLGYNCYFFTRVVSVLAEELFAGREMTREAGSTMGKVFGLLELHSLQGLNFKAKLEEVRVLYRQKWKAIEENWKDQETLANLKAQSAAVRFDCYSSAITPAETHIEALN